MVGAGLSRQGEPGHPTEARPPSWAQLAVLLQEELRCGKPGSGPSSAAEPVTARDCSRLAQQFKATFGQSALDSFLLARVPDGEPHSGHERLLRLPWADVFTTNWDTLLEKASEDVSNRTYQPVFRSADLATTVAPRIVKLHGSFPAYRPFVVTEEDYRTYPTRFAPLVNTVQQALMECIFLLVGFSGDDPNFLHWCGWVRDHLGPAAPRLYLAGCLNLGRPTRLMLEERGVVPIDLAPELSGVTSPEARHRAATEWILSSLEAGETREERWPFLSPSHEPGDGNSGIPLPVPSTGVPLEEPDARYESANPEAPAEAVKKAAEIWRHNRSVYPGWPVLPFSKYSHLSASVWRWDQPMLKAVPALNLTDRLAVVRELIERIELLMDRLTPELAKAATDALSAAEEYLEGNADLSDERRNEIQEHRAALMLAVLTDARYELDQASFDEWGRRLDGIVRPGTTAFHRLHHERCLWKLTEQDFAGLGEHLSAWRTGDTDPMWSLRKAALLVASGDVDGGQGLALRTLQRCEQAWSRDSCVLTGARLGWALYWRHALNRAKWWNEVRQGNRSAQPDGDLWARLAPHDADSRSDLDAYVRQMTEEQSEDSPWTFDLGRESRIKLSNADYRSFRRAWRVIRLLELSGLPSGIPGVRMAGDYSDRAARLVAPFVPAYAARLLLVGGSRNEKALKSVVSQTHLARMSRHEVSALFIAAQRARDYFLERWTPGGTADEFLGERAVNAIEIMSRCVVRHGAASAPEIFTWALQYRRSRRWVDNQFWSCIASLWERSWDAMDLESRTGAILEILRAPIPEDALRTNKDPGDLLLRELPEIKRSDADQAVWASCVRQICIALRGSEDTRTLAFDRLNWIARKRLLVGAEEREVALSLWGNMHQEPDGLPHVRQVDDWIYLVLPEPEPGIAERRFRAKWIGRAVNGAWDLDRNATIRNIAAAWNSDHAEERVISLSEQEETWFWDLVDGWLRRESGQGVVLGNSRDYAVRLLVEVLPHRRAPVSVIRRMGESATSILAERTPAADQWGSPENEYRMVAASAALGGADAGETEHQLRIGTRSVDAGVSLAAWSAVGWWIDQGTGTEEVPMNRPSVESVRDIGVAIGTSQQSGLLGALRAASAVYRSRNPKFIEAIHSPVIQGLRRLRTELDYRTSVADRWVADELPLRRHWCVWLALAMTGADKGDDEVIRLWIEEGDGDPLCLVRFAREWYAAAEADGDTEENP